MKSVFFKMFGWLLNPGIASQCFSLCLMATLLRHINCSFVSSSALCITTALCRKLRHHEHVHARLSHFVTNGLFCMQRLDSTMKEHFQSCEEMRQKNLKKIAEDPFVTFHQWHVRAMFMQIGGEQHWLFCSRRPKQSNLLGMTDES